MTLEKSLRNDRVDRLRLRPAFAVAPTAPVEHAVRGMTEQKIGYALVTDAAGKLVGIFTERDFLGRIVAAGLPSTTPVEKAMSPAPRTVGPEASVHEAVEVMANAGYRHLPVVDASGKAVGVLSVKDVVHYLVEYFPAKVYNLPPSADQQAQPAREGA